MSTIIETKIKQKNIIRRLWKQFRLWALRKFYIESYANKIIEDNYHPSKDFVNLSKHNHIFNESNPKLIAFYLPQFYTFKENDEWHGRGFTEWTNVTSAIPQFTGHYQPKLPIDVGFYDLSNINIMKRQAEIAKQYGVHGWCFHYYWFSGKRLMEDPVFNLLENPEIDMPFCFNWANESWSKLWNGSNKELLIEQNLQDDDDEKFMNDILPFIKDRRYIKINNRPMLMIYRPSVFGKERTLKLIANLRRIAKENGFEDLYMICVMHQLFKEENPIEWGFDAGVEFPPHEFMHLPHIKNKKYVNKYFEGKISDMSNFIKRRQYMYKYDYKMFKTVFPSWDNSARKAYNGASVFINETPELYKKWLNDCICWTKTNLDKEEQFVFINAWNEWAEGAYLEPDRKYGYAYLQATKEALESSH